MKKIIVSVVIAAIVVYVFGVLIPDLKEKREVAKNEAESANFAKDPALNEQGGQPGGPGAPGMGGPGGPGGGPGRRNPTDQLRNDEGRIEIAKLDASEIPDQFKESLKENLTKADANGDGILSDEEEAELQKFQREAMRARMFDGLKNDDGQYDLAKLSDRMPDPMKDAIRGADADGDGLLNEEELQAAKDALDKLPPPEPRGGGPGGPGMAPPPAPEK